MTPLEKIEKIRDGLYECKNTLWQTPATIVLTNHVFGISGKSGIGIESAVALLANRGFDPPNDPKWFSAPLACQMLGL